MLLGELLLHSSPIKVGGVCFVFMQGKVGGMCASVCAMSVMQSVILCMQVIMNLGDRGLVTCSTDNFIILWKVN